MESLTLGSSKLSPREVQALASQAADPPRILIVVPTTSLLSVPPNVLFMEPKHDGRTFLADAYHTSRIVRATLAGSNLWDLAKEFRGDGLYIGGQAFGETARLGKKPITTYDEVQHLFRQQMAPRVPTQTVTLVVASREWSKAKRWAASHLGIDDDDELLVRATDRCVPEHTTADSVGPIEKIRFHLTEDELELMELNARSDGFTELSAWVRAAVKDFLDAPFA